MEATIEPKRVIRELVHKGLKSGNSRSGLRSIRMDALVIVAKRRRYLRRLVVQSPQLSELGV